MAISTINKVKTNDEGFSTPIDCPVCSHNVALRLFSTSDNSIVVSLLKEDKDLRVAVCPSCATVFSVNKNYLKERNAGTFVTMTKEDLKIVVKGQ